MIKFPVIRFKLPAIVQRRVDQHYLDISLSRVLPLMTLLVFGALVGFVFNTGITHPYDKVVHIGFYALLTLSIHAFFCCRLRISAMVSFGLGVTGELVQGFLPHHYMSMPDIFANAIGVALIVALIALLRSESRQAVLHEAPDFDLNQMGLEPVRARYLSGAPSDDTGFSSDK